MIIDVWMDYVTVNGVRIERPRNVGRSQWMRHWEFMSRYRWG